MKAFLFDVDDTLYDQVQPFFYALTDIGIDISEKDRNSLFARSRKYSDEVFEASAHGEITMAEMYIYRIKRALDDFGIMISDKEALLFQAHYQTHQKNIQLSDEMRRMLEDVKGKVMLGIITNGPSEHQREKIQSLGLYRWIDEKNIIVSGDLDITKPDPEIFAYAISGMNIKAEDCIFVGDSYENDVIGAARAGMKTVWFNRRGKKTDADIKPDYTVYREQELHALLVGLTN